MVDWGHPVDQTQNQSAILLSLLLSPNPSSSNLISCCSFLVSTMSECVLGGLLALKLPTCACPDGSLPDERSLDFAGLPGEPVYAGSTALSSPRATWSCVFVCCPRKSVNKIIDLSSSMLDHLGHLGWAIKAELHLIPRVRVGFRNFQGTLFIKLLVAKHDWTVSERYTYIRSVLLAMSYDIA